MYSNNNVLWDYIISDLSKLSIFKDTICRRQIQWAKMAENVFEKGENI